MNRALAQAAQEADSDSPIAISSLIDIAFLLLIYFLVTSTLLPQEGDLVMELPGPQDGQCVIQPDFMEVNLTSDGIISVSGKSLGAGSTGARELGLQLRSYVSLCKVLEATPVVYVVPDDRAQHQDFIHVLNEVSRSGISSVMIRGIDAPA